MGRQTRYIIEKTLTMREITDTVNNVKRANISLEAVDSLSHETHAVS